MVVIPTCISYSILTILATPAFNQMSSMTSTEDLKTAENAITHPNSSIDRRVALPSTEDGAYNPYTASELCNIPIEMVNSVICHKSIERARAQAVKQRD